MINFDDVLCFLGWSEPAAYGMQIPADCACKCRDACHCNAQPWDKKRRQRMTESIQAATEQVEALLGEAVCPEGEVSELVYLKDGQCNVFLKNRIGYLGKKITTALDVFDVRYSDGLICAQNADGCVEDWIAQVVLTPADLDALPDGVEPSQLLASYVASDCVGHSQQLSKPACVRVLKAGECDDLPDGGVILQWKLYHMVKPTECAVNPLTTDGFIEQVAVSYWQIDASQAIEPLETCKCGKCDDGCGSLLYTATVNDVGCGEICIDTVGCRCGHASGAFRIHYGVAADDLSVGLKDAISYLALARMGKDSPCVTCSGFGDPNNYLRDATEFVGERDTFKTFQLGSTYAHVCAQRLIEQEKARREQRQCDCQAIRKRRRHRSHDFRTVWTSNGRLTKRSRRALMR